MVNENHEQDDGRPWGFMSDGWCWNEIPKLPILRAGIGPPPFEIELPGGQIRHIVHNPMETQNVGCTD